jgi:hypothetical protein
MASVRVRAEDGRAEEGREDGANEGKSAPNTAVPLTEGARSARGELGSRRVWPLLGRGTAKEKEEDMGQSRSKRRKHVLQPNFLTGNGA